MNRSFALIILLLAGLLIGSTGVATAAVTVSLVATNNTSYYIDDSAAGVGFANIPLVKFKVVSTEAAAVTVTKLKLVQTAGTNNVLDFAATLYKEGSLTGASSGVIDAGDVAVAGAGPVNIAPVAATDTLIFTPSTPISIAAGETVNFIVAVKGNATIALNDGMELAFADTTAAGVVEAIRLGTGVATISRTAGVDPTKAANVPLVRMVNLGLGSTPIAFGDHAVPIAGGTLLPNNKANQVIASFKLTPAGGTKGVVVDKIALNEAGGPLANSFTNVRFYLDANTDGLMDAGDVLLTTTATGLTVSANTTYTLSTPVWFPALGVQSFLVVANGAGIAVEGSTLTVSVTAPAAALARANGALTASGTSSAVALTAKALILSAASTKDFVNFSYNSSRPNGFLDAVKLTFTANGASAPINDATLVASDFAVTSSGATGAVTFANRTFASNWQGDVANNDFAYIKFNENSAQGNTVYAKTGDLTVDVAYTKTGSNARLADATGNYALADGSALANITDGAAPAPITIKTIDFDVDGKIDRVEIQFSEAIAAASTGEDAADDSVATKLSVRGYTAPLIVGLGAGDAAWPGSTKLTVSFTEKATGFDTGAIPFVTFTPGATTGIYKDAANNDVLAWGVDHIATLDNVAPRIVKVTTSDADTEGHLDGLIVDFSEPVQYATGKTEADLVLVGGVTTGFAFDSGTGWNTVYSFATGHTGIGTASMTLKVNPRAEFDGGEKPIVNYTSGAGVLVDMSPSKHVLATVAMAPQIDATGVTTSVNNIWLADGIAPIMKSATTMDGASVFPTPTVTNGKIDTIKLVFTELMGLTAASYDSVTVAGNLVTAGSAVILGDTVWVKFAEAGANVYNTGVLPAIAFNAATKPLKDLNGVAMNLLPALDTAKVFDGAAPYVWKVVTEDKGYAKKNITPQPKANDGRIDALRLYLSEAADTTKVGKGATGSFAVTGYAVSDTTVKRDASGFELVVPLVQGAVGTWDTNATPAISIQASTAGGGVLSQIKDAAMNRAALGALVATTDAAAPVLKLAATTDDNLDGFIDGVRMQFSENIVIADADTDKVKTTVGVGKIKNTISFSAASVRKNILVDGLTLIGTSSMSSELWDTGITPKVTVKASSGIKDAAGNEVVAMATADSVTTVDEALPGIGKAVVGVGTKNIAITFTEKVTNSAGATLATANFGYVNVQDSTSLVTLSSISDNNFAPMDSLTFQLVVSKTLTANHADKDKLAVKATQIKDFVGNYAPIDTVAISDTMTPYLVSAETQDIDHNGFIDHLKLTFSEPIKNSLLDDYPEGSGFPVSEQANRFLHSGDKTDSLWQVTGYDVIGINQMKNQTEATNKTKSMRQFDYIPDWWTIPYVPEVNDDAIIYLAIRPLGDEAPAKGDTDATPKLSMKGGAESTNVSLAGSGVADSYPNYVASFTNFQTTDGASPQIMSIDMKDDEGEPSLETMTVEFSEKLQTPLPSAAATLRWIVGTELVDYTTAGYVINFRKDADLNHIYYLDLQKGNNVPSLSNVTLAYRAAGLIKDAAGIFNTLAAGDTVSTTAPSAQTIIVDGGEGEEAAAPEVFALSKNFPNPFNPTTTINYDIAGNGGHVEMVIYNVTGQKVRTLVSETKPAGFYSVTWDGKDDMGMTVASGIYLYKIVCGDFSKVERMNFIK